MLLCAVLVGVLGVGHRGARADEDARSYFNRGKAAFALGKYSEAADLYEKAFALHDDPALLYNAAQAHRLGGNKQRALMLYQNYIRLYGANRGNRAEVERHIAALKAAIDADTKVSTQLPQVPATVEPPPGGTHPTTTQPTTSEPRPATTTPERPSAPAAAVAATPAPKEDRPIWKKGWFWGAVAGGVVVVGLAVGLGVGLGAKSDPTPSLGTVQALSVH